MSTENVVPFPAPNGKIFEPVDVQFDRQRWERNTWALQISLKLIGKPRMELDDLCRRIGPEEAASLAGFLSEAADHIKAGAELMETAHARILLAITQPKPNGD